MNVRTKYGLRPSQAVVLLFCFADPSKKRVGGHEILVPESLDRDTAPTSARWPSPRTECDGTPNLRYAP